LGHPPRSPWMAQQHAFQARDKQTNKQTNKQTVGHSHHVKALTRAYDILPADGPARVRCASALSATWVVARSTPEYRRCCW